MYLRRVSALMVLMGALSTSPSYAALHWSPENHQVVMGSSNFVFEVETSTAGMFQSFDCDTFTIVGTTGTPSAQWRAGGLGANGCVNLQGGMLRNWEMIAENTMAAKLSVPATGELRFEIPVGSGCNIYIKQNSIMGAYMNFGDAVNPSRWKLSAASVNITQTQTGGRNCFSPANVGRIKARFLVTDLTAPGQAVILSN